MSLVKMNSRLTSTLFNTTKEFGRFSTMGVTSVRNNYTHIEHSRQANFKLSVRALPHPKEKRPPEPKIKVPNNFRTVYPEFLPDPDLTLRNKLREKIERIDMLHRRKMIDIPEFYIGSIMAVTVNDVNALDKSLRFTGICIDRGGHGLRAWFILRNFIDHQGLEILYEMYCPLISSIETLRLERRLDPHLLYLRDALPHYSTVPLDMEQEMVAEGAPVPVNEVKVKLRPRPWHSKWEQHEEIQGIDFENYLTEDDLYEAQKKRTHPELKYDIMKEYRGTIPSEEQESIFREVLPYYPALRAAQRRYRRR